MGVSVKLNEVVVVVTGAGQGLGESLARAARSRGAGCVVVADLDAARAEIVAREVDGLAIAADLSLESGVTSIVEATEKAVGPIDVWIANAGIGEISDPFTDDAVFDRMWRLHVMSQVWAARALVPGWLERGSGHFAAVASSNALTSNPVSMGYAATKHAQLAAVEWLGMTYGARGISTTAFCPKGMLTPLLLEIAKTDAYGKTALVGALTPAEAASVFLDAIEADQTIAHTYAPVLDDARLRVDDHDAYLQRLQGLHELVPHIGSPR
jgi:NAD(P)-dependent dehydrogenase (short-subunit alcohol dehydrogenase family)